MSAVDAAQGRLEPGRQDDGPRRDRHHGDRGPGFGVLIVMPLFLTDFLQLLMTKFLVIAIYGMGYNLVYGYTGMLSLGHGAFFGVGAYTAGLLTLHTTHHQLLGGTPGRHRWPSRGWCRHLLASSSCG